MPRLVLLLLLALLSGPQLVCAQAEDGVSRRIEALERELEAQRRAAVRNASAATAIAIALTAFGLYRRRTESARLAERFGITDPLTGLRNRQYVTQTIEADCRVAARQHRDAAAAGLPPPADADLLFVLLDVDRLKAINERHGQLAGDRLLTQIAAALRATCRTSDIIARWDGEEFLVVLRFTNRDTAPLSAERIRMAVEGGVVRLNDGRTTGCTCSIGFAPFPLEPSEPDAVPWERVVALADEALQRAKQSGGNTWVGADAAQLVTVG